MVAASLSGVLSHTKLPGSSLSNSDVRFLSSVPRGGHVASFARLSSNGFNSADKPSSKARNMNSQANCGVGVCTSDENVAHHAHDIDEKIGVLLLNLVGPETLQDVQPFRFNGIEVLILFLYAGFQRLLVKLILVLRAPKSKEGYAAIGGGSPLRKITSEQANAIRMALEAKNVNANVYVGIIYTYESIYYAQQIKQDRITKLVVLPLYPQFSISTTGSSTRVLQDIFRKDAYLLGLPVSIILSWYQRRGYISSMADLIKEELEKFAETEEVMIFFSAHGVPVSCVEDAGDPYKDQMEECIYLIMQELIARGIANDHTLAYQSRVGPVQWMKPYTDEVLVEFDQRALESGIENWGRVPALGCTSSFITDLADAVVEALPSTKALSASQEDDEESEHDPVKYLVKLFFGSILAFFLILARLHQGGTCI
ncbi:Ferrochelatase-2 [Hibiscus syriacus]|uniref:Ferrochelatase n=1 Tax=Hibiscus syriacus TaxID=106335 RepID=A0A6A2XQY3_HIBSY|nr:Ferrochelatase-2 [Hibiscus syriacus]